MKARFFLPAALLLVGSLIEVNGHFKPDTSLVVTTINEYELDGQWFFIDREILGYDDQHRRLFLSFESISDYEEFRYIWKYDEDGIRAEKVMLIEDLDSSWTFARLDSIYSHPLSDTVISIQQGHDRYSSTYADVTNYDEAGRVTETIRYRISDGEWTEHTAYEYDEQGNLITETSREIPVGEEQLVNTRRGTYTYENGKIQTCYRFNWNRNEQQWDRTAETHYTYTTVKNKHIREELYQRLIDDQWQKYTRVFDTTGVDGLVTGQLRQYWEDGMWVDDYKKQFSYDFMGNVVLELRQVPENSVWVDQERTRYEYAYYVDQNSTRLASKQKPRYEISVSESRNELKLTGLGGVGQMVTCRIYDLRGRVLFKEMIPVAHSNVISIPKSRNVASGIRIFQLSTRENGVIFRGRLNF